MQKSNKELYKQVKLGHAKIKNLTKVIKICIEEDSLQPRKRPC